MTTLTQSGTVYVTAAGDILCYHDRIPVKVHDRCDCCGILTGPRHLEPQLHMDGRVRLCGSCKDYIGRLGRVPNLQEWYRH